MKLIRVDTTIEKCVEHLSVSSAYGTEIESLLTQSLLVIMCAEFEQKIEKIILERYSSIPDKPIRDFVESCLGAVFRSIKSSEIAGLLNRFGSRYKDLFVEKTKENELAVTFYNNIVVNRHRTAHSDGSSITFQEAVQFYEKGHIILDLFREVLLSTGSTETT